MVVVILPRDDAGAAIDPPPQRSRTLSLHRAPSCVPLLRLTRLCVSGRIDAWMDQLLAISVGVVPPLRITEMWSYLVSILLGATLYAIFVASLTAVFSEVGASSRKCG